MTGTMSAESHGKGFLTVILDLNDINSVCGLAHNYHTILFVEFGLACLFLFGHFGRDWAKIIYNEILERCPVFRGREPELASKAYLGLLNNFSLFPTRDTGPDDAFTSLSGVHNVAAVIACSGVDYCLF